MSVMDFEVTKDGYCVKTAVPDESINESSTFNAETICSTWASKMKNIAHDVYSLQYDTDMRPSTISEFEVLNSRIVNVSNTLADMMACETNVLKAKNKAIRLSTHAIASPYALVISANMMKIAAEINKSGMSNFRMHYKPKLFNYYGMGNDIFCSINTELSAGLSNRIVETDMLVAAKVYNAIDLYQDFDSFKDVFEYIFGSYGETIALFDTEYVDAKNILSQIVEQARTHPDYSNGFPHSCDSASDLVCYASFKAVSRSSFENLEDVYSNGTIPDTVYDRLAKMAMTVVNEFNVFWQLSYMNMMTLLNNISIRDYAEDVCKKVAAMNKPAPQPQPVPATPEYVGE